MNTLRNACFAMTLALAGVPAVLAGESPPPASAPPNAGAPPNANANGAVEERLRQAQERLSAAAREVADLSAQYGRQFNFQLALEPRGAPPRALLGVNIDNGSHRDGAHVVNVSPGGAAAEAGIKPGDIITSLAGEDLTKDSDPSRALVEKMRTIEPDAKVKVELLRDGRKMTVDVTARPAPADVLIARGPGRGAGEGGAMRAQPLPALPALPGVPAERGPGWAEETRRLQDRVRETQERLIDMQGRPGERTTMIVRDLNDPGTRLGGMEFATLSERLGSYFGVKTGVLVVRAGVSSPWKLQDGDVILAIDGRDATSAQHAGRILRSYQPGEKLTLKVQRDRKAQNIEVTAPAERDRN